jgi:hypothetical protein
VSWRRAAQKRLAAGGRARPCRGWTKGSTRRRAGRAVVTAMALTPVCALGAARPCYQCAPAWRCKRPLSAQRPNVASSPAPAEVVSQRVGWCTARQKIFEGILPIGSEGESPWEFFSKLQSLLHWHGVCFRAKVGKFPVKNGSYDCFRWKCHPLPEMSPPPGGADISSGNSVITCRK